MNQLDFGKKASSTRGGRVPVLPLAIRLLSMATLCAGSLLVMTAMQSARGQYPQQPFPVNQNFGDPQRREFENSGFQNGQASGIPSVPAPATVAGDTANAATENAGDASVDTPVQDGFQFPAIVEKLVQGGWLMIPLGICSLIVFTLSLERLIALRRSRVIPRPFVRRFTECVEDGQLSYDEATTICEEFDCPVAEVFQAAVRRWGRPMLEVEQAVMDAGDRVADGLKRFLRVFHAISNVAPLLGLLGTVLGMIEAFEVMSGQESLGRPEMLASGISVALVTTAGGLAVAIPAYLAYMYFSSKSDRYLGEIDKLCQRVVDCISAEGLQNGGGRGQKKKAA